MIITIVIFFFSIFSKCSNMSYITFILGNKNKQNNLSLMSLDTKMLEGWQKHWYKILSSGTSEKTDYALWGISSTNNCPFWSVQRCCIDGQKGKGREDKERARVSGSFISPHSTKSQVHAEMLPYKIADLQAKPWWILCQGILIGMAVVKGNGGLCYRNQTTFHLCKYC